MSLERTHSDEPAYRAAEQTDRGHSRRRFLTAATTAGLVATVAGCSAISEAVNPIEGDTESSNNTARLVLDGAPGGLRKFQATIRATSGDVITSIDPGVIDGDEFQVTAGGVDSAETTVRAVDLSGSVGSFTDQRPLVTVTFESEIDESDVDVSTSQVTDDGGGTIPDDDIHLELSA